MKPRILNPNLAILVSPEEARAALWVMENSKFTGRKHPDARDFATRVRRQGVDLKQTPSTNY